MAREVQLHKGLALVPVMAACTVVAVALTLAALFPLGAGGFIAILVVGIAATAFMALRLWDERGYGSPESQHEKARHREPGHAFLH